MHELSCTTTVSVRKLRLLADIGINPDEVGRRQPLVVSVDLTLEARHVASLDDTVDYRRVAEAAETLALDHVPLIETFAHRLAARCLSFSGVSNVSVVVRKPFALTRGIAETRVRACHDHPPADYETITTDGGEANGR